MVALRFFVKLTEGLRDCSGAYGGLCENAADGLRAAIRNLDGLAPASGNPLVRPAMRRLHSLQSGGALIVADCQNAPKKVKLTPVGS